jgi:SAM-dependent methyltransferase
VLFYTFFRDVEGTILEIGCTIGNFISLAPERIRGIDIDKKALEVAKSRGFDVDYMTVDEKLNFDDNTFSGIFSSYVIEHLKDPLFALKEMHRILKPNGKLVMLTTDFVNTHGLRNGNFYDDYTHIRPFTKISLEKIAYDAGFRDCQSNYAYRTVTGFGWLVRKKILSPKQIVFIQKALWKLRIRSNTIELICRKN